MRHFLAVFAVLSFIILHQAFSQCDGLVAGDNDSPPYVITGTCIISGDVLIKSGSTTITGTLEVDGDLTYDASPGTFLVNGGSVEVTGTFQNKNNGDVTITNGANFVAGTDGDTGIRFDNQNDGTITVSGSSNVTVNGDYYNNGNGNFSSGGIVTVTGDFSQNGGGNLTVSGGLVIGGTLENKDGDITIEDGAVLSADDVTGGGSGELTIETGGTLAANSISEDFTNTDGGANPCPDGCCGALCDAPGTGLSNAGLAVIGQAVLPIELLSFEVSSTKESVLIQWTSGSELNNDYYTLERSVNGVEFQEITEIRGAGTSNAALRYEFTDYPSSFGLNYYRLTQTDYDGTSETFAIRSVLVHQPSLRHIQLSPTYLSAGQFVSTRNVWGHDLDFQATLIDLSGRQYSINTHFVEKKKLMIKTPASMPLGLYVFKGLVNGIPVKSKLLIE